MSAPIRRLLSRRVVKPADNKTGKKKLRELSRKMLRDKVLRELAVRCKGLDSDISSRQESCRGASRWFREPRAHVFRPLLAAAGPWQHQSCALFFQCLQHGYITRRIMLNVHPTALLLAVKPARCGGRAFRTCNVQYSIFTVLGSP